VGREVEISDIVRMIEDCAPDARMRVTTHSILVTRAGATTKFSKGTGAPRRPADAKGSERARVAKKVAGVLAIPPSCANKHFPGLFESGPEKIGTATSPER